MQQHALTAVEMCAEKRWRFSNRAARKTQHPAHELTCQHNKFDF